MVSTVDELLAEALFVSDVQPSQTCSCALVEAAVTQMIRRYGSGGCAEAVAAEFGDHPEIAVRRMGWVRHTLSVYPAVAAADGNGCGVDRDREDRDRDRQDRDGDRDRDRDRSVVALTD